MRAVRVQEHGGPDRLVLAEVPDPAPRPDEVVVRIKAAALNHLDLWIRKGVPGHTFRLPITPGADGAGVVEAAGSTVAHVAAGDEVVLLPGVSCGHCEACLSGQDNLCPDYGILGETRDGTCAELVAVPSQNVARKPASLSFEEAAAFPLTFQTAWNMLSRKARLAPGETALILAAGSGVGSAGVQIARLLGATVLAVAGGSEKTRRALELGAHHAVDHTQASFAKTVKELTGGRGVDVVMEHVGAATFAESMKCLARGGRLVTCGATTGPKAELHLNLLFFKNLEVLGSTMGSKGDLLRLLRLAGEGRLRPVVDRVLPLDRVAEGHRLLEERQVFGKVVLKP